VAFSEVVLVSVSLHAGQRLAKPGLPGLSSNSSEQITQTFIGNAIVFVLILITVASDANSSAQKW
jgi:hypothetical protein